MTTENTSQGQERRAARAPGVLATPWRVVEEPDGLWIIDAHDVMVCRLFASKVPLPGVAAVENAEYVVAAVNDHAGREAELARLTDLAASWEREVVHYREVEHALREELRVARETAGRLAVSLQDCVEVMGCEMNGYARWVSGGPGQRYKDARSHAANVLAKGKAEPRRDGDPVPGADPSFTAYLQDKWSGRLDDQHDDVRPEVSPAGGGDSLP